MTETPKDLYVDIEQYEPTEYFTESKGFILLSNQGRVIYMDIEAQKDKKYIILDSEPLTHISERGLQGLNKARKAAGLIYPCKVHYDGFIGSEKSIQYQFKVSKVTKQDTL